VKHFSGNMTYLRSFELPADRLKTPRVLVLNRGTVKNVAEVMRCGYGDGRLADAPDLLPCDDQSALGVVLLATEALGFPTNGGRDEAIS
jgi:hypothetical protein